MQHKRHQYNACTGILRPRKLNKFCAPNTTICYTNDMNTIWNKYAPLCTLHNSQSRRWLKQESFLTQVSYNSWVAILENLKWNNLNHCVVSVWYKNWLNEILWNSKFSVRCLSSGGNYCFHLQDIRIDSTKYGGCNIIQNTGAYT
jgi:hypothetical protein